MICNIGPNAGEFETLSSLKGSTLERIEGYRLFEDPSVFNQAIRLVTGKGTVSLVCESRPEPVYENGDTEEMGILTVDPGAADVWLPDDQRLTKEAVGATVTSIKAVALDVTLTNGEQEDGHVRYLQAVALQTDRGWLCFDKGPWFSEFITVMRAASLKELPIGDGDWGSDEPYGVIVAKNVVDL